MTIVNVGSSPLFDPMGNSETPDQGTDSTPEFFEPDAISAGDELGWVPDGHVDSDAGADPLVTSSPFDDVPNSGWTSA